MLVKFCVKNGTLCTCIFVNIYINNDMGRKMGFRTQNNKNELKGIFVFISLGAVTTT